MKEGETCDECRAPRYLSGTKDTEPMGRTGAAREALLRHAAGAGAGALFAFSLFSSRARAEPTIELSGASGLGVFVVGITPARFAISPSGSISVRGERAFFVARETLSFLGANGGRFGIDGETTVGGGIFWEYVNLSAGLSLVGYSLPICGPRWCDFQVRGVAPGASVRGDFFGPYLSGALGVSLDCAGVWITGSASPVWSGVSVRCSAGPIFRFTSH